jgi:alkanesulfonate monooxygenase SsuD/methylene tetrahydromethanopterin reductase-like flavin-dependent oxidoreductase (luciferase family)
MHFGVFLEERRRGVGELAALQETLDLVEASEAWGLDAVWLGEIHFNGSRSVQSAPLPLAAFIAARTRRIRVGTAVQVLPLANPLKIAEEVATVDQLSQGRFDFGIGRSGSPRAYDVLGIPYGESQARFVEAVEILREAFKGQPFSYAGKFHRFQNITVSPSSFQKPYPPMRMAANTPSTFPQVAQLGLPLFVGLRDHDIPSLRTHLKIYREAWHASGQPGPADVFLRIPVYAATTEKDAREEPREMITYFFERHAELVRSRLGRKDTGATAKTEELAEQVEALTYDTILDTRVAFGTPGHLVDRLAEIRDELQLTGIVAELNPGGLLDLPKMRRTLELLTHEVMPRLH